MLKMKQVSETYDMRVFTDSGDYFGNVEEAVMYLKTEFKRQGRELSIEKKPTAF